MSDLPTHIINDEENERLLDLLTRHALDIGAASTATVRVVEEWLVDSPFKDVSAIQRVPCPDCDGRGLTFSLMLNEHGEPVEQMGSDPRQCLKCDGRGWLYPNLPEWWSAFGFEGASNLARSEWIDFCNLLWRVLDMYQGGVDE